MHPFELSGEGFLIFYFVFGQVMFYLLRAWKKTEREGKEDNVSQFAKDPYLIAYLRAGAREVADLAELTLIRIGLLKTVDPRSNIATQELSQVPLHPVEKEMLHYYSRSLVPQTSPDLATLPTVQALERKVVRLGWKLPEQSVRRRNYLIALVLAFMTVMSLIRIGAALAHGRYNFLFLIIMNAGFIFYGKELATRHLTSLGEELLEDLRTLLSNRPWRQSLSEGKSEIATLTLYAAVFGPQAIPNSDASTGSDGGGSCGSGGSSCSSGGCGGGGGCGGCGGGGCGS